MKPKARIIHKFVESVLLILLYPLRPILPFSRDFPSLRQELREVWHR